MKKLFIIMIVCIVIVTTVVINANRNEVFTGMLIEDMNIDESILTKIKSLGIDLQNTACTELEPDELKKYNDFVNEDISNQQKYSGIWSTILHKKLDKLDVKVKGSSALKGYPVNNLFDKRIDTAWVPGIKGDDIGEWVLIELNLRVNSTDCPVILNKFGIIPGYLKNDKTWEENNRVKSALLIIERNRNDDSGKRSGYIDYVILRLQLNDFKGLQTFNIADFEAVATINKRIWIIIEDVYKGTKFDDTCISEIVIAGEIPGCFFGP